ncbi:MAG: hypothetical protein HYX27_01500 [Acidobacteria bacterium]|nr:hypothetical protein [Acidobacteriota bacterium]
MSSFRRGLTSLPVQAILAAGLYGQAVPQIPAPTAPPASTGQTPAPAKPATQAVDDTMLKRKSYVRPFSAGVMLSVLGQIPIQDGGFSDALTNQTRDASTTARGYRIGYGVTGQVRLPRKFAFSVSVAQHKSGHSSTLDQYDGVDNPNTPLDDRKHTTIEESSIVKYWDYTFVLRRYTKDHTAPGHRAFFEGGLNMRNVKSVRSTRETTITETVADSVPVVPANKVARGLVGGVGAQFVDDFGVKLVPEFRYTRWLQPSFDALSTMSRKNQFEAIVSITF